MREKHMKHTSRSFRPARVDGNGLRYDRHTAGRVWHLLSNSQLPAPCSDWFCFVCCHNHGIWARTPAQPDRILVVRIFVSLHGCRQKPSACTSQQPPLLCTTWRCIRSASSGDTTAQSRASRFTAGAALLPPARCDYTARTYPKSGNMKAALYFNSTQKRQHLPF